MKTHNQLGYDIIREKKQQERWERAKQNGLRLPWETTGNSEREVQKDSPEKLESD